VLWSGVWSGGEEGSPYQAVVERHVDWILEISSMDLETNWVQVFNLSRAALVEVGDEGESEGFKVPK
jgi:hypothetical protein